MPLETLPNLFSPFLQTPPNLLLSFPEQRQWGSSCDVLRRSGGTDTFAVGVDGCDGVFNTCADSRTVRCVLYISTLGPETFNVEFFGSSGTPAAVDESSWTDVEFLWSLRMFVEAYVATKMATKKLILEFGEKNGLDVVAGQPSCVVGPFICPRWPDLIRRFSNVGPTRLSEESVLLRLSQEIKDALATLQQTFTVSNESSGFFTMTGYSSKEVMRKKWGRIRIRRRWIKYEGHKDWDEFLCEATELQEARHAFLESAQYHAHQGL
ncbi:NAD(P)-binding Rossmann-fold superfamily protein [Striga asiatica]|uniref:NAD(P)-binding Rossmann-fold superfamily protein n=1 Tax=Striga asiatica TaxID=4170 RepID=A0A5A7RA42_STRAF|nr:NAD(P)-binding Rossmann-fold superfamily protein [Striga asiatica]